MFLPEVIVDAIEVPRTQGQHGIKPLRSPAHARALGPSTHGGLAGGFGNATAHKLRRESTSMNVFIEMYSSGLLIPPLYHTLANMTQSKVFEREF